MKNTTTHYKIVTWNVNSLRTRLQHVLDFLKEYQPDVLLLQELKCETEKFPSMEIEELRYNCAVIGQKTYNGVAILSKSPIEDSRTHLYEDAQARYIEAITYAGNHAIRVASVYVPNGQAINSEKFHYKLEFLQHLRQHLAHLLTLEEITIIGGDYNVAYLPHDVYDARACEGEIGYHPTERASLREILNLGYYDAFRLSHPSSHAYSWWDYRGSGLERDHGMRIDHLLLSPEAVDRFHTSNIIKEMRAREKPSDHAPVLCSLAL